MSKIEFCIWIKIWGKMWVSAVGFSRQKFLSCSPNSGYMPNWWQWVYHYFVWFKVKTSVVAKLYFLFVILPVSDVPSVSPRWCRGGAYVFRWSLDFAGTTNSHKPNWSIGRNRSRGTRGLHSMPCQGILSILLHVQPVGEPHTAGLQCPASPV